MLHFCTIFSLDMKALPVTISWLWSRFILKLSVKFVRKFSQKLHKMQNLFLAHTSNLDFTKGAEFDSRMVHFKILIIFSIYLVHYKFDMKSFTLIRNINYNVINYILNFICIFNHRCYCS